MYIFEGRNIYMSRTCTLHVRKVVLKKNLQTLIKLILSFPKI
jgi:hypothetical protein